MNIYIYIWIQWCMLCYTIKCNKTCQLVAWVHHCHCIPSRLINWGQQKSYHTWCITEDSMIHSNRKQWSFNYMQVDTHLSFTIFKLMHIHYIYIKGHTIFNIKLVKLALWTITGSSLPGKHILIHLLLTQHAVPLH